MRELQLDATVCDVSDPELGVVILQDASDTALVQFTGGLPDLTPGDKIGIHHRYVLVRRRELGVEVSMPAVVNNDGLHGRSTSPGTTRLKKGRHSITVEWFNRNLPPSLEIKWQLQGAQPAEIPSTNLFFLVPGAESETNFQPGLLAECYEGSWERVPGFDLLKPVKTVVVTNFIPEVRPRNEFFGVRFRGFFDIPADGVYTFTTRSAEGSLMFIDRTPVTVEKTGNGEVPKAVPLAINELMTGATNQQWVTVQGRVESVESKGRGVELKLSSARNSLVVSVADARGLITSNLLNSEIRVTGLGCPMFDLRGDSMLGKVAAANARNLEVSQPPKHELPDSTLTRAEQVRGLTLEDAARHLPVRLQGVVTSKGRPQDDWFSVQDETRGIFIRARAPNVLPMTGDFYEIVGHSEVGDFAPIVVAERLRRLGRGEFPRPIAPTWDEFNNGSMDVQWVEFKGLVTKVQANTLSMLLPSGLLDVRMDDPDFVGLRTLDKAVVCVRGVLFAQWNSAHEVNAGSIVMRNGSITIDTPVPHDPFDAVLKTTRELLLFDPEATAFRKVKVRGQIIYSDDKQAFLQEDGQGLRLLPAEKNVFRPGDVVEAAGYLSISRAALLLHEAEIRKIGATNLPPVSELSDSLSDLQGFDATRVRIRGTLRGWHLEQNQTVLEMQTGTHLYFARLPQLRQTPMREGMELAIAGVFVRQGGNSPANSFELLVNAPGDIHILSEPPWWTLGRLLILVGVLLGILTFSALWITQLRRVVEQRTVQLKRETEERQRAEQQRAVEVERSRIARDLHDDLGASLTEIAVLAGKARRVNTVEDGVFAMLRTIGTKARELVGALDIIVWAVDPKDNSLQSLADYLCDFADEYLSPAGISCRFDVPVTLPNIVFEGRDRHDLFLAVKETLNNIVRHANATQVEFRVAVTNGRLQIVIMDNGRGFDVTSPTNGRGLRGLPVRLARIGGQHKIESAPGKGTVVTIEMALPAEKISSNDS